MNIASRLIEFALKNPNKTAIIDARTDESITFGELEDKIARICHSLLELGFKPGSRTLLFVKPSLDFHALVFSLFKIGIIPVLIDPGMGRKNLLAAIKHTNPDGLIAEPIVHYMSYFFRSTFKSAKIKVWTSDIKKFLGSKRADEVAKVNEHDPAAILFTSGGTGTPKGVVYTHHIFSKQTEKLQEMFGLTSDDVDLPGFPLFSLFTLAMGMTTLIPSMDPSKPGQCDPAKLSANILKYQATFVAGSPAIWSRVAAFAIEAELKFQSIKQVVMFGAPVRNELHRDLLSIVPNGNTYAPYGATEALPLCLSDGKWLLENTVDKTNQGSGTCVGSAIDGVDIEIIQISDDAIDEMNPSLLKDRNQIGEIIVRGQTVTKSYDQMSDATKLSKIKDGETFWHRMGDIGYLDDDNRLWFCGRKAHRIDSASGLMAPIQVEAIFNQHPKVSRSALIGDSQDIPAIVIELKHGLKPNDLIRKELIALAKSSALTSSISQVFFNDSFPVDVRHNIKIDRIKLSKMYF